MSAAAIGIDLGGTRIKGVAVTKEGEILRQLVWQTNDNINDDTFMMKVAPEWDKLRDDPRFIELANKVHLP